MDEKKLDKVTNDVTTNDASSNVSSTSTTTTSSPYLNDDERISRIKDMYNSQLNAQKAQLEADYNQNISDAEANREKIYKTYQDNRNASAADYERQRRNFNESAAANGINTGTASQVRLALMNQQQKTQDKFNTAQADALTAADRNMADIKRNYQSAISNATATNDYKLAASLLDEYNAIYNRALSKAETLSQFGDFSGYKGIYSDSEINNMRNIWIIQNPSLAYQTGAIDANRYRGITGEYPLGYSVPGGGGYSQQGAYIDGKYYNASEVAAIQQKLGVKPDGAWGPISRAAYEEMKQSEESEEG